MGVKGKSNFYYSLEIIPVFIPKTAHWVENGLSQKTGIPSEDKAALGAKILF